MSPEDIIVGLGISLWGFGQLHTSQHGAWTAAWSTHRDGGRWACQASATSEAAAIAALVEAMRAEARERLDGELLNCERANILKALEAA